VGMRDGPSHDRSLVTDLAPLGHCYVLDEETGRTALVVPEITPSRMSAGRTNHEL
jgi:hypothetical protein